MTRLERIEALEDQVADLEARVSALEGAEPPVEPPIEPEPPVEPEPDPEPDPDPEPEPATKRVRWDRLSGGLTGIPLNDIGGNPINGNLNEMFGSSPIDIDDINPRAIFSQYRLTVLEGDLTISAAGTSGPYSPAIEGISNGAQLHEGDSKVITLRLGPGSPPPEGQWVQSNFHIDSDAGKLMSLSAQVAQR